MAVAAASPAAVPAAARDKRLLRKRWKEKFLIMYLVSLKSTHHAMMLEHIVKEANIKSMTIPTPRAVTKSCGMSIKFQEEIPLEKVVDMVESHKLKVVGIFEVGNDSLERVYTNMED